MSWTAIEDGWVENSKQGSVNGTDGIILYKPESGASYL